MKKFTLIMSLLLTLFATTTSAQILDRSGWKVTVSGEQPSDGGGKDAIIDGDNSTYWHSRWTSSGEGDNSRSLPQFFQIDLGSEQEFNTLGYMPRPYIYGIGNGTVYDYKLYVSDTPFENVSSDKSAADIVNALGTADIESSFDYSNDGSVATLKTYTFPKMLKGRYVLFVATRAEDDHLGSYASCAEFYLSKDTEITTPTTPTTPTSKPLTNILNRSNWKVTVSGEQTDDGGGKDAIIDGDNSTYWHSRYWTNLPQFFQIDLGSEQEFNALGYMPRPNIGNGTVYDYKLYVSDTPFENVSSDKSAADIVNALGTADIESSFDYSNDGNESTLKTYRFPKVLRGRYVLFVATRGKKVETSGSYASCAEFYLANETENTTPTSKPLTNILNRSNWVITTSGECDDVQYNTGHADAIIDGNSETFWHSNFGGSNGSGDETRKLPQFFQVDLGSVQEFNALGYLPRSNFYNGVITSYKVYVSNTPFESVTNNRSAADVVNNLGTADYEGSFSYEGETVATLKTCQFPKMLKGRYVLFVAMESENSDYGVAYACCAEFYLAKELENITYHFKVDGVEYGKKTISSIFGNPIPTMPFLINGELTPTSDGYDIACTVNTPFVAQSTFDANTAQWYALNINGTSGNYLLSNKGGSIVSTTTVSLDNHPDVLEDAYLWAFVGNLKDGYRIYSKVDHKSLALYNQLMLKKGNGSIFRPYEKSDNSSFGLYVDEEKLLTRESEDKIIASTEDNNDDRSTFRVQDSKLYVTNYAKPFISAINDIETDTEAPENAIWANLYMSNPTNRAKYRALFLAVSSDDATNEQIAALGAENIKITNEKNINPFEEGKYYRLYNKGDKERWLNVTLDAENTSKTSCNLDAEKSVTSVVNFKKMSRVSNYFDLIINGISIGQTLIEATHNIFRFKMGLAYGELYEEFIDTGILESNGYSEWYVVSATEAEIAMSEVNGKSYASAYLPFPVNGVSGAEAYVGKLNDAKDMLNMTQVQGVAANTGFVLVGNADKATLSIGETTETATSDLKGSNKNIVLSTTTTDLHEDYLVFGVSDGNVGFYTPSFWIETIPANKAYLRANQLASKAIAMNFGDNTTSIGNATVVANENAPIYDLSGRRVAKTIKGGVYIQNGKKFVK